MNWKEISKKYPRAVSKAVLSIPTIDTPGHPDYGYPKYLRELYDFFDEQGIYIEVDLDYDDSGNNQDWIYAIHQVKNNEPIDRLYYSFIDNDNTHPTRKDIEGAAFIKAFEILEEKLKSLIKKYREKLNNND